MFQRLDRMFRNSTDALKAFAQSCVKFREEKNLSEIELSSFLETYAKPEEICIEKPELISDPEPISELDEEVLKNYEEQKKIEVESEPVPDAVDSEDSNSEPDVDFLNEYNYSKALIEAEKEAEREETSRNLAKLNAKLGKIREIENENRRKAEKKAKEEAEELARIEADKKSKKEAETKAIEEAEKEAKRKAEKKSKQEATLKARQQQELKKADFDYYYKNKTHPLKGSIRLHQAPSGSIRLHQAPSGSIRLHQAPSPKTLTPSLDMMVVLVKLFDTHSFRTLFGLGWGQNQPFSLYLCT